MYTIKSEELKRLRKEKNISQNEIAEMLNIEQTTYSKIETGKSSLKIDTAYKIASILETDIKSFIDQPNTNELLESSINSSVKIYENVDYSDTEIKIKDKIVTFLEEIIRLIKK